MRKNKERTRFIRKRVLFFCCYEGYRGETAGGGWHGRHWSNRRLWDRTPPGGFVRRRRGQLLATQADVWCCRSAMSGRGFRYSPAGADLFHEGRDGRRTGGDMRADVGQSEKKRWQISWVSEKKRILQSVPAPCCHSIGACGDRGRTKRQET